jgi:UDP-glucose 4-epimerase
MKGKKVLITGGLGFIGSNLVRSCLDAGAEVTVYDCLDPHSGGNMCNIEDIAGRISLCVSDILNFDRLCESVIGQDIIVNCAASTSHSFSMREPWLDQDVNNRGMINILEAMRRFNREARFIHLGTSTQLGRLEYEPADEKHPEFPTDIYSANKSVSEKYALIYANAHQLRTTVLRLSNVFGPRASIHSPEFTFNNFFIGLALQDKPITVYGDGKQLRNVIYVEDVVRTIIDVSTLEKSIGQVYFVVSDEHESVIGIAEQTVKVIGRGKVIQIDWPEMRQKTEIGNAVLSNAKLKAVLPGWSCTDSLVTGLEKTREYYTDKLDRYLGK